MPKKIIIVLICLYQATFFSQDFYGLWYGNNGNILNKANHLSCSVQPLSICQPTYEAPYSGDPPYLDIAVDRQHLYSVTSKGTLYRQNLNGPLNCQVLGSFGYLVNALVADSAETLYAVGMDSLGINSYLLRYSGGIFSNLGALPSPYKSAGDLFFYEHRLFLTSYSTSPNPSQNDDQFLVDIDMVTPSQSCIYMPLPLTPLGYWGTFSVWNGSQSQVFTQGNSGIQEIDMKCKTMGAATCTILSGGCRGFASWYPFTSSTSASNCNTVAVSLITSTTQMCEGETATLTANGWSTYTWSVPGTQSNIAVTPSTTTTYTISGTDSTGCPTSMSVIIYVNPAPAVTISGQSTLCAGSAILLTAAGAQSYSWSTGGFTSIIYPSPQADTVFSVTGTGSNGCTAVAQFSVSVFDCVGIDEKSTTASSVTVFPNPGKGPFQCVSDAFIREAIIFDGLAREVKRINNCGTRITIEDLRPGIYFLLLSTEQETLSIKFVALE